MSARSDDGVPLFPSMAASVEVTPYTNNEDPYVMGQVPIALLRVRGILSSSKTRRFKPTV